MASSPDKTTSTEGTSATGVSQSHCDLELLVQCASYSYGLKGETGIPYLEDPNVDQYLLDANKVFERKGYKCHSAIAPKEEGGNNASHLGMAVFVPDDADSPIVISFRGTKYARDFLSDAHLVTRGQVEKDLINSAYFSAHGAMAALQAQNKYSNREFVFTGHSLGGHLAQNVAARMYDQALRVQKPEKEQGSPSSTPLPKVHVRAFNPAKIVTKEQERIKEHPEIEQRFACYRTDSDFVSKESLKKTIGNFYSFSDPYYTNLDKTGWDTVIDCCTAPLKAAISIALVVPAAMWVSEKISEFFKSHFLDSVERAIPKEVLNSRVGPGGGRSATLNNLIEELQAIPRAYECRVRGKWFDFMKVADRNKTTIQGGVGKIIEALKEVPPNIKMAIEEAEDMQSRVNGTISERYCKGINRLLDQFQKEELTLQVEKEQNPQDGDLQERGRSRTKSIDFFHHEHDTSGTTQQYKSTFKRIAERLFGGSSNDQDPDAPEEESERRGSSPKR